MDKANPIVAIYRESRRRGVFKIAVLYAVCAWLVMQVGDVFFPAWGIPDAALNTLLTGAMLGFPLVLWFGWIFDVTVDGIRRTPPAGTDVAAAPPLKRTDHLVLAAMTAALALIVYSVIVDILGTRQAVTELAVGRSEKPPNSIAVLPFSNLSNEPENEFFCDGLSEEILHRLSDYRDMHVLARQSSFAFKGAGYDVPRLSEALGVRYILQGSVRRDGDDLRIAAQLVDDTGRQLWSESFDRTMESIFTVQSEIAAAVADNLAETMAASRVVSNSYEPEVEAYQQYLLGREYLRTRPPGFAEKAIAHFETAAAIDPDYPEPYAGHAIALLLGRSSATELVGNFGRADALIQKALSLDGDLAIGLAARGLYLQMKDPPDNEGSERALRQALEVDPFLPVVRGAWLYNAIIAQGRMAEAFAERDRALARNPLDPRVAANVATNLLRVGEIGAAESQLRKLLQLPQPPGFVYWELYWLYAIHSRHAEAIESMKQAIVARLGAGADPSVEISHLAVSYAHLGMWAQADRWQARAEALAPTDPGTVLRRGLIYKLKGDHEAMDREVASLIDALGLDYERLPPWVGGVAGAVKISVGEVEEGIQLLEASLDWEESEPNKLTIDLMQYLAFAHLENDNEERAAEIIEFTTAALDKRLEQNQYHAPDFLGLVFQNQAVLRNTEATLDALEAAIGAGWRDYYWVLNDKRWTWLHGHPRFEAFMARMKTEVEEQRARVKQADASGELERMLESA
ncbi:MAG: hypothetical protein R3348_01205 [Xanthomonadales bacterium]|nr:hypothetical protein [Xanthomonadales bacterium]